jgi:hypothetical protein
MAFTLMPSNQLIVHVVDASGKKATSQYYVDSGETNPASGAPAAISAAVQGMSNGLVYQTEILRHAINATPGTPSTGNFARVMDKMSLTFNTAAGDNVTIQIPGPLDTILGPDGVKVDPTDALIVALIAGLQADGVSAGGADITSLQRGNRRWPKGLKKY